MASNTLTLLILAMVVLPGAVTAKEYIVGDEAGWTIGFDYQAWSQDKQFMVGDKLVFKYLAGAHNVFKVNGTSFQSCTVPPASEALTSGNDVIILATPGRKWYMCGVGKHCAVGQKLFITVLPAAAQSPSIPPFLFPAPAPAPWYNFSRKVLF